MARKDAILEAASRLFAVNGFSETSSAEIAKEAGVAEGTLFYHFKSKEGILCAVFEQVVTALSQGMEAASQKADSGMDALEAILRFGRGFKKEYSEKALIVMRDMPLHADQEYPMLYEVRSEWIARVVGLIRQTIERGIEDGSIIEVDPTQTALLIHGLTTGVFRQELLGLKWASLEQDEVVSFCRRSLAARC